MSALHNGKLMTARPSNIVGFPAIELVDGRYGSRADHVQKEGTRGTILSLTVNAACTRWLQARGMN